MKKLLIATTALVATAGVAAADVAVTGNGRMGVVYDGADLNFSSRIRVVFTASGETDGGLSFGGSFRADNAGGAANGIDGNIFISGAFGKLAMGDVVGAAEAVIGDLPEIGYTDIAANDITYITGDGVLDEGSNPVMLYTYTAGDLTFALSASDGVNAAPAGFVNTSEYALGVKYAFGDFAVALGYESSKTEGAPSASHIILGVDAKFGETDVKAFYGEASDLDYTQYGVGVTSKFDAITVKGFARVDDFGALGDVTNIGLGAAYSLGGGATVEGGVTDNDAPGSDPRYDLGIKFSF
jgi:outer membrane protein OmpU